ncbi:MAG: hypothetical protein RDU25_01395 [Patescibacteria group bacterium]|nr:hypothetical protein [Patescibacteria group bacterium]
MAEERFLETVLRTERLTEREWLALIEERRLDVGSWIPQISSVKLSTFPCIDRRAEGRGFIPVDTKAFPNREHLNVRGIFERKPPRSTSDDWSFYIIGFLANYSWILASVQIHASSEGVERVDMAKLEVAAPAHIVELTKMSYGDLWFMLGHAVEDLAKKRREELERLTALEQRVKLQNQMVVAIETDRKVMG